MSDPSPTRLANAIRFLAIDAIVRAGEGHQGVPLGMAEIATALYTRHLKFDAGDPTWPDRDRVVLSNGHGSMLLYALLHLSGYERIGIEQVSTFRDFGSRCEGHPEIDPAAGIEATTGPLGQGIANAFGMAVAEAYLNARFGAGVVDHRTYAFVGDGCLQEGIGQEMISLAGHLRLGKLTLLWDDNRITDDGATGLSISEDVAARFRVADWHVVEVDGHDLEAVSVAIGAAKADPRPSLIACRTVIAKGIARLQGQRGGTAPSCSPKTPRRRVSSWAGRHRRSRCRPTCWLAGAPPAAADAPSATAGALAWSRCRRPSVSSSNASSPASCPKAGATCCWPTSSARSAASHCPAASSSPPRSTTGWSIACQSAWSAAQTSKRPPTTSGASPPSRRAIAAAPMCIAVCAST
jgi:transketolase N-terminal domain/subunit